ncbi:transcriptional regulator, AsnC family [Ignisphaera aggregans DSM 17230]|uniref:Transcriptional regulator, AsnC family n=1 Tax=Ignisphaera aggregans (strain DSM 17230 / JCM 13409 / AQ1.S1) TaxID=583356 RepID=E0SRD6_IGNAA|nr:transcriptional regulator, AsnC family [Ignisphaera aggregans DSM 17230]
MVELDEIDILILRLVIHDCSLSVREISRLLQKSPTTIAKKIQRLRDSGVIERCEAILDYKKLGYNIMALILINVEGAHIEDVEKMLSSEPNVRAVYDITGEFDVAIIALFRDVDELDRFVKRLLKNPYVKRSVTNVIFKAVKDGVNIDVFG